MVFRRIWLRGKAGEMRECLNASIMPLWSEETGLLWGAVLAHEVHTWLNQRHATTLGSPVVGGPRPLTTGAYGISRDSRGSTTLLARLPRLQLPPCNNCQCRYVYKKQNGTCAYPSLILNAGNDGHPTSRQGPKFVSVKRRKESS